MDNNNDTKHTVCNIFDNNDSSVSSFNSYLVAALNRLGIDVVFNKTGPELEDGPFFGGIMLVLVIFSVTYTFSVACLENLVKLQDFLQEKGHVVVPVFYDESVSALKEQVETRDVFDVLQKSYYVDQVTNWRRALVKILDLQGHEYNNKLREESKFIERIAQDVFEKLYPTEHIGIHKKLLELENLVCKQRWGLRTIAIFGNPGIGKTTLVKAALLRMSSGYDAHRFIVVGNEKNIEFFSYEDFKQIPMEKFDLNNQDPEPCHRSKRVLIVLDDVRSAQDAKAFLGEFKRFGPGSLLIITSQHLKVLQQCNVNEIYELKGLDNEDSMKLYTRCFFREGVVDEKLLNISVKEIERCDGNPSSIRSYAEKASANSESITSVQSFLLTKAAINYQSDLEKCSELDIANHIFVYMLRDLRTYYLYHDFVQQSFFSATIYNSMFNLKDLSRFNIPSLALELLHSDLRILHFYQGYVVASQLDRDWEEYESFLRLKRMKLGQSKKQFEVEEISEERDIEQINRGDCTSMERLTIRDQLEPHQLLISGCIEIKPPPKLIPPNPIIALKHECQILQWRLQYDHLCLLCNSENVTESHLYCDCTFTRSIWNTISNRIHISPSRVWEDAQSAIINAKESKVKKVLSLMAWSSTIYGLWVERNQRLYKRSYRSADAIMAQIDRIFRNRASLLRESRPKIASKVLQLWLGTSSSH